MSLESGSRRAIDNQWVRENETREYKIDYNEDEYTKAVRILAKSKKVPWFDNLLQSYIKRLNGMGYEINPDQFVADIDRQVHINVFGGNAEDYDRYVEKRNAWFAAVRAGEIQPPIESKEEISDVNQVESSSNDTRVETEEERTRRQIEELKNNLAAIFGDSTEEISGFHR